MDDFQGFPVATAATIEAVVAGLDFKPWQLIRQETVPEYLAGGEGRQAQFNRFGMRVDWYRLPDGTLYDAFMLVREDVNAIVFPKPVDGYIFVMAGPRHNNGGIVLTLVSGSAGKEEREITDPAERMRRVAMREWVEETGIAIDGVTPIGASVEKNWGRTDVYLGDLRKPLEIGPQKLDPGEDTKIIALRWQDWLAICMQGNGPNYTVKDAGVMGTFRALMALGLLEPASYQS